MCLGNIEDVCSVHSFISQMSLKLCQSVRAWGNFIVRKEILKYRMRLRSETWQVKETLLLHFLAEYNFSLDDYSGVFKLDPNKNKRHLKTKKTPRHHQYRVWK